MNGRLLSLVVATSAIGAAATTTTPARAQDVEPIAVAYDAPAECPGADAFFHEVTARTSRARAAQPGDKARTLHVVIAKRGAGHAGRLWIEDASGSGSAREVAGGSCGEVVGALALIGALAVDPRASTAPRPAPVVAAGPAPGATPGPSGTNPVPGGTGPGPGTNQGPTGPNPSSGTNPGPTGPNPSSGTNPGPAGPNPSSGTNPGPAATAAPSVPNSTDETPRKPDGRDRIGPHNPLRQREAERGRFEVGLQAEAAFVASGVVSGRLFGDLELGRQDAVFAPALRLAIGRSLDVDRSVSAGGAKLRWTVGAFEACPIRLALARPLAARPCVEVAAGVLDASGTGVNGAESRTRPWAALDAVGRLALEPVSWLAIELEAGVIAPLYRESFFFEPGVTVYEAPTVAFLGRGGFAVRFP